MTAIAKIPVGLTASTVLVDAARAGARRWRPAQGALRPDALEAGVRWLTRTHDACGRAGSSKGYSLVHGWMPAYPETTGYVLEVLQWHGERTGQNDLCERAREMADWLAQTQQPDGGIMEGHVETRPRRSIVFNTGMVLHGWVTLIEQGQNEWSSAAERAASFLVARMNADGTWDPSVEYGGIPHTYNARVAWAMARYAELAGDATVRSAASRQLDWVLARQRGDGWFDDCVFRPGMLPSTHGIAYTLRGLLEGGLVLQEERWIAAVQRTSEVLIRKLEVLDDLPGSFAEGFSRGANYQCLTGSVQLGGVWMRLFEHADDPRFLNAGLKALDLGGSHQARSRSHDVDGAIAGSFPVWGRYAPFQYPNWATRFFVESLMIRQRCLGA